MKAVWYLLVKFLNLTELNLTILSRLKTGSVVKDIVEILYC